LQIVAEIDDQDHAPQCGDCLTHARPFDHTFALFPYEAPIVQLIIQLKFQGKLHVAQSLGEMFSHKIKSIWYREKRLPDLIIPVPLHERRLRERGFNQALEIAKPIAKSLKIQIDFSHTVRTKHTRPQSSLTKSEREENLKNAFKVLRNYTGLYIAVIDDVITTGQTITTFSQLLKENGAARIDVWCGARRG
jgi:ComF family protein